MKIARIEMPDGRIGRFEVPDSTTPESVSELIRSQHPEMFGIREPTTYEKVRPYVETGLEGIGLVGGSVMGAAGGTVLGGPGVGTAVGGVAGAGLGYAQAREAMNLLDRWFGGQQTELSPAALGNALKEAGTNIAKGAAMEMTAQGIAPVIARGAKATVNAFRDRSGQRAARIARQAAERAGEGTVYNALRNAPEGYSPGQALAGENVPTMQALLDMVKGMEPEAANTLRIGQNAAANNALAFQSSGKTLTEVRNAAEASGKTVEKLLGHERSAILAAADEAGDKLPGFMKSAAEFRKAASQSVDDVIRFEGSKERASTWARTWRPSHMDQSDVPTLIPKKHTYPGHLEKLAEKVSTEAAQASLDYGSAARFNEYMASSLEAHGLKPLSAGPLIAKIRELSGNPNYALNKKLGPALSKLVDTVDTWSKNGILKSDVVEAIRKNGVNALIDDLAITDDATKLLAQKVLASELKPVLVKMIEDAGGKGYAEYLAAYSSGLGAKSQREMIGNLMQLYRDAPDQFIKIVEGNNPTWVEQSLGQGRYNIAKELPGDAFATLKEVAKGVGASKEAARQAGEGQTALRRIIDDNSSRLRMPNWLNVKATVANEVIRELQNRLSRETLDILAKAGTSPEGMVNLLDRLPPAERSKLVKSAREIAKAKGLSGIGNALDTDQQQNQNALAPR